MEKGGILLPFLIVTLIWSSTWIVIRDQLGTVPPSWSVCYRFLIAGIGMVILARMRRVPLTIGWDGLAFATLLGLAQFVLNFNFVYRAEQYLTSGVVAIVYAMLLIPNSLLGWIAYRQPLNRGFLIGSGIAVAGIALLLAHEYRAASIDPADVVLGVALCLAGLMSASTANVMQGSAIAHRLPMIALLAWAMLIGAAIDAGWAWANHGPPVIDTRPAYLLGVAYLAIAGSVVTFPLYFRLIQRMGAARAAYTGVLIPVIAMLISTLVEGYAWSAMAAIGALLAVIGMIVAMRARDRPVGA
jgi:drug/metabolite transporter (DMT)-like permease